jgi:hypothetical protein
LRDEADKKERIRRKRVMMFFELSPRVALDQNIIKDHFELPPLLYYFCQ